MIYIDLFLGFLKVGCFAFGGAYGAIPLIRDVVLSYGWLSDEKLTYMIAVSESTPGPIMVNLATYIGSSQAVLRGLKPCIIGIVLATGIYMVLMNCFGTICAAKVDLQAILITILLFASMAGYKQIVKNKLSPIMLIILSALIGIGVYGI